MCDGHNAMTIAPWPSAIGGKIYLLSVNYFPSCFNPLPNDKIWTKTKLKAFAEHKFHVAKMMIYVFDNVEKPVAIGQSAFSPFPTMFTTSFYFRVVKTGIVW